MSNTDTASKRKYTKTPRWTIKSERDSGVSNTTETSGLIDALKLANNLLRDGAADSVTISRIKKDA